MAAQACVTKSLCSYAIRESREIIQLALRVSPLLSIYWRLKYKILNDIYKISSKNKFLWKGRVDSSGIAVSDSMLSLPLHNFFFFFFELVS